MDAINNNARARLNKPLYGRFRLLSMSVSFGNYDVVSFDFGINVEEVDVNYRYYTLFIGSNGVGKSSLLHEIVEFLVDAYEGVYTRTKYFVNIRSITYEQGYGIFRIEGYDSG